MVAKLCLLLILFVPFAVVGLALLNSGLGRCRSAAHVMMASLCVFAVTSLVYIAVGFSWQGGRQVNLFFIVVGGKAWSWIAAEPFFARAVQFDLSA